MTEVTAIVTCMTDAERPFMRAAVRSVASQTVACSTRIYVQRDNDWIEDAVSGFSGIVVRRIPLAEPAYVRNLGVLESDTEWVAFLDGDDVWVADKLERQLACASEGIDFVGTGHVMVDEDGRKCAYGQARYIPMTSSWFVRRAVMLQHPFEIGYSGVEDGRWWTQTVRVTSRVRIPDALIEYRVRASSLSSNIDAPSKRRKHTIVRLGQRPGVRPVVLAVTWLAYRLNRSTSYRWLTDWDAPPTVGGRA